MSEPDGRLGYPLPACRPGLPEISPPEAKLLGRRGPVLLEFSGKIPTPPTPPLPEEGSRVHSYVPAFISFSMKLDSGEISLEFPKIPLEFPKIPQNHMKDDTRNESILSTEARRGKNAS